MILLFGLDQIRLAERRESSQLFKDFMSRLCFLEPPLQSLKKSLEVVRSFFRWQHIDQLFLIPITIWAMIENGFIVAQFTRVR